MSRRCQSEYRLVASCLLVLASSFTTSHLLPVFTVRRPGVATFLEPFLVCSSLVVIVRAVLFVRRNVGFALFVVTRHTHRYRAALSSRAVFTPRHSLNDPSCSSYKLPLLLRLSLFAWSINTRSHVWLRYSSRCKYSRTTKPATINSATSAKPKTVPPRHL